MDLIKASQMQTKNFKIINKYKYKFIITVLDGLLFIFILILMSAQYSLGAKPLSLYLCDLDKTYEISDICDL